MKAFRRFVVLVSALAITLSAAGAAQAGLTSGAVPAPYCGIRWGSLPKASPTMTQAPIIGARVGRHNCYDRLVIDLGAIPAAGFSVRYANGFYHEASGAMLLVHGGAIINVTVNAPAYDADGNPPPRGAGAP